MIDKQRNMLNYASFFMVLGLAAIPAAVLAAEKGPAQKVIYGADDRLDYYQAPPAMRRLADSVVSLWKASDVAPDGAGFRLATAGHGEVMGLCPGEPFREQPMGAFCSGALVGPDLVMTAGHCIKNEEDCAGTAFVFGFRLDEAGGKPGSAGAADVYSCKGIVKRYLEQLQGGAPALGADYALVRLDRPVPGRAPLGVDRGTGPAAGDGLFVIGHPSGLPLKVAGGAAVRDASPETYFTANLDTYGGNSGSPVFAARTGLVTGILVRGENDYIFTDGCLVSNAVPDGGGRGEDVTKLAPLLPFIPEAAADVPPVQAAGRAERVPGAAAEAVARARGW